MLFRSGIIGDLYELTDEMTKNKSSFINTNFFTITFILNIIIEIIRPELQINNFISSLEKCTNTLTILFKYLLMDKRLEYKLYRLKRSIRYRRYKLFLKRISLAMASTEHALYNFGKLLLTAVVRTLVFTINVLFLPTIYFLGKINQEKLKHLAKLFRISNGVKLLEILFKLISNVLNGKIQDEDNMIEKLKRMSRVK